VTPPGAQMTASTSHDGSRADRAQDARLQTVLVCDDATGFRTMLGGFLSDAGYEVSFAGTRDDSVAGATAQQPDAMLVDPWMPIYDPALLRRLRACSPRSAIVMLSVLPAAESTRIIADVTDITAIASKRDRPDTIVAAVTAALLTPQRTG
jgi:DNA-binding response OmpR family regulator